MTYYLVDLNADYPQNLLANKDQGMIDQAVKEGYAFAARPYSDQEIDFILRVTKATMETREADVHDERWDTTAGGPGTGKSTDFLRFLCERAGIELPERFWQQASLREAVLAFNAQQNTTRFISPDRRALLDLVAALDEAIVRVMAQGDDALLNDTMSALRKGIVTPHIYAYLRPGANFLNLAQMESGYGNGYSIGHDTTLSSPMALGNLRAAREDGRKVGVRVYGAPREERDPGIDSRIERGFFQSWRANTIQQDTNFANNLPNVPAVADSIDFLWRDSWSCEPALAARFERGAKPAIYDLHDWAKFHRLYGDSMTVFPSGSRDLWRPAP